MAKVIDHNNFWYIEKNPISRAGIFPYLGREIGLPDLEADKIYNVLRSEKELMNPEAIKSFELLPIIKGHRMLGPAENGLTPAENIPQQGIVGEEVFAQGDTLYANIKITSEQAKDDINNGLKELSLGYFCEWVKESGEYKGQHYDIVQKNIRGNHLAIVPRGRMGHGVRVMDALPSALAGSCACDSLELSGPLLRQAQDNDFDESKVKRDELGRFAEKNGLSTQKQTEKSKGSANGGSRNEEINKRRAELKSKIKEPYYDKERYEKLKAALEKGKELGLRQQDYFNYVNKLLNEYNTSIEEEAKSLPPEDKASNLLREGAHNTANYRYKKINKDNFFETTMANFNQVKSAPDREPDYVSKSGSKYWYEKDGVYRQSNHWGDGISSCSWFIDGKLEEYAYFVNSLEKDITGFTKWNNFTSTAKLTVRELLDIFKNAKAELKDNYKDKEKQTPIVKGYLDSLSSKQSGADGISAAPEKKENAQMDKSKIAAEILAIASKPESEFEDGKEGQMKAVIGLLDKVADNKSASGANDDKGALEEDKADSANPSEKDEKDDTANDKAPCDKDKAEDALEARIMEKMAKKLALYEKVSPFTGSFDHSPMSLAQMAKYACDKLGIKGIAEDSAETALTGYLAGAQKQVVFREAVNGAVGDAMPVEKDAAFEKYLKEAN